jgi:hypothetical protein
MGGRRDTRGEDTSVSKTGGQVQKRNRAGNGHLFLDRIEKKRLVCMTTHVPSQKQTRHRTAVSCHEQALSLILISITVPWLCRLDLKPTNYPTEIPAFSPAFHHTTPIESPAFRQDTQTGKDGGHACALVCHLLERNLDTKIAARHHDAVRNCEDFVEVLHTLLGLDLGEDHHVTSGKAEHLCIQHTHTHTHAHSLSTCALARIRDPTSPPSQKEKRPYEARNIMALRRPSSAARWLASAHLRWQGRPPRKPHHPLLSTQELFRTSASNLCSTFVDFHTPACFGISSASFLTRPDPPRQKSRS